MKKNILAFVALVFFVACNNNPSVKPEASQSAVNNDTATSASGQKDNGQSVMMNGVSDTLVGKDGSQYVKVTPDTAKAAPVAAATPVKHTKKTSRHHSSAGSANSTVGSSGAAPSSTETASAPVQKKKGWSNAAKGTAIGAGAGAVTGAIVSKKKGTGAIIGGLIGAGGGYLIGHSKDKKEKKKQQQQQ